MERLTVPNINLGRTRGNLLPSYEAIYGRLREYEDLEEQGKLMKLSCAVGDTVYFPYEEFNFVFPVIISQIIISDLGEGKFCVQYNGCFFDGLGDPEKDFEFDMEDFGKTVFLTKEEAEQALENMNDRRN